MLDPSCLRLLRILSMAPAAQADGVAARRENFRKLMEIAGGAAPANIVAHDGTLQAAAGPLLYRSYRRHDSLSRALPTCVFLHGGGFVAGSVGTHDRVCRTLADASSWQILSVEYRLAPEHPFPAQIEDGMAMVSAVMGGPDRFGADDRAIAVAGDSVGAGLAACLAQQWRARQGRELALQVLICPALEAEPRRSSRREFARGFYIEDHMIAADFAAYRGASEKVPSVFDCTDLAGLPPAIIHVAACDPFRDEGLDYGRALKEAGVDVELTKHAGMLHLFHAFGKFIPAAEAALREIGAQMRAHGEACRQTAAPGHGDKA